MIKGKRLMLNKFFGFSKTQVDAYIDTIKKEQEDQIQDLKNQIAAVSGENEKLNEEARLLRAEKMAYESEADIIRLSKERLEKVVAAINKDAQQESAGILDSYEQKLAVYDDELIQIKNEIKGTMKSINSIAQGIMELLKNGMSETDDIIEKSTETATASKVYPYAANEQKESSGVQSDMTVETPEIECGPKSETDDLAGPVLLRDGSNKSGFSVSVKGRKYTVPFFERNTSGNTLENSWEEALQGDKAHKQNDSNRVMEDDALKAEAVAETESKDKEQASAEAAASAESSSAVAREISRIRQKYILGKIAGEDLLDSKGNIIIAKNQVITEEVVEKAERESKLSELILNMVFPDINSGESLNEC